MADADALFDRAIFLHRQGRYEDAIATYRELLRHDKGLAAAHTNLGAALIQAGRLDDAVRSFERAAALKPEEPRVHLNLAGAAIQAGRSAHATDHLAAAYLLAPDDLDTRRLLTDALRRGVPTDRRQHLDSALAALAADPAVDLVPLAPAIITRVKAAKPVARALARFDATPHLERALARPEMLALLRDHVVADLEIEALLTRLRTAWLAAPDRPPRDLLEAAALHAHTTEWVLDETAAERQHLTDLERLLDDPDARVDGDAPSPALLVYALYRPLACFADDARLRRLAESEGSGSELLHRHLIEPDSDVALARLTDVDDIVSTEVRDQYEQSPYPRWRRLPRRDARPIGEALAEALETQDLAAEIDLPAPRVLVAGCGTGRHACLTATRFAGASVLAVDLSRTSLTYAARRAEALGIDNITFAEADVLGLGGLEERFDVIECSGVLHHMADPEAGWRILRGLLKPRGLMRIALYSASGRAGIDEARTIVAEHGLTPTPDGIRVARALIRALPADAPARAFADSADFYSLSGCRDMLFHVHEDRFTLPRIAEALAALDLEFLGFELPDPRIRDLYRRTFPDDPTCRDLEAWDRLESDHPTLFAAMYQFWTRALEAT